MLSARRTMCLVALPAAALANITVTPLGHAHVGEFESNLKATMNDHACSIGRRVQVKQFSGCPWMNNMSGEIIDESAEGWQVQLDPATMRRGSDDDFRRDWMEKKGWKYVIPEGSLKVLPIFVVTQMDRDDSPYYDWFEFYDTMRKKTYEVRAYKPVDGEQTFSEEQVQEHVHDDIANEDSLLAYECETGAIDTMVQFRLQRPRKYVVLGTKEFERVENGQRATIQKMEANGDCQMLIEREDGSDVIVTGVLSKDLVPVHQNQSRLFAEVKKFFHHLAAQKKVTKPVQQTKPELKKGKSMMFKKSRQSLDEVALLEAEEKWNALPNQFRQYLDQTRDWFTDAPLAVFLVSINGQPTLTKAQQIKLSLEQGEKVIVTAGKHKDLTGNVISVFWAFETCLVKTAEKDIEVDFSNIILASMIAPPAKKQGTVFMRNPARILSPRTAKLNSSGLLRTMSVPNAIV